MDMCRSQNKSEIGIRKSGYEYFTGQCKSTRVQLKQWCALPTGCFYNSWAFELTRVILGVVTQIS